MVKSLEHLIEVDRASDAAVPADLRAAQALLGRDRARGLAALEQLFRSGRPPDAPLQGRYRGELIALDIAPGFTQLASAVAGLWLPWRGKTFDPIRARGDNILTRDSLILARLYWPLYRHYVRDKADTYRAFAFRTEVGPGLLQPTLQVLKIDYDLPENPRLNIRRILDELVQVSQDLYLGQALVHWWWGTWQRVGYFTLRPMEGQDGDEHS